MKAHSKETYSKSTICDFLLMVNSYHGHITYRLRDIFAYRGWKPPFCPLCSDCRPTVEKCSAISMLTIHCWKLHLVGYNSIADNIGLQSIFIHLDVVTWKSAKSRNIPRKFELKWIKVIRSIDQKCICN